jgi:hypothetical protein
MKHAAQVLCLLAITAIATKSFAEDRMVIADNMLIYDLSESSRLPIGDRMILPDDHVLLAELLMEHPLVDTVVVSGDGGFNWPAYEMARKISRFGLNTVARNTCASACTTVLLGGVDRTMETGASIGFHSMSNDANDLRDAYDRLKEKRGWKNEFEFASYVFERGVESSRNYIDFLMSRGVKLEFALRALTYESNKMWYPTEEELLDSGVLTKEAKTSEDEIETPFDCHSVFSSFGRDAGVYDFR